jgi:hypothetical protein
MNGTLLNTVTFAELTDLIRKDFVKVQNMIVPQAQQIFIKDPVGKNQGNTKRYDEIDTQTFARRKYEAAAAKKAQVGIGYNVTMTKKRIALEVDITQEMRDENRYVEVGSLITNLSHFCPQRIELDLTHRLTFSNATSYTDMDGDSVSTTVGDGLAVISNVHTLQFSSSTYSNRVSGDPLFSRGALESAEMLTTTNILSNFGERRVMSFNAIITGDDPGTCNNVKQFLESTSDVDQNNPNVINVYSRKYRHIILPYLATTATSAADSTKRRWWFLAAVGQGINGWQAYYGVWEEPHMSTMPSEGNNAVDSHRDIWTFGTRAGYGIQAVSGRGIISSQPVN